MGGENYLYSLLTGYEEPPADVEVPDGGYYNAYFPGHVIAMPPPLSDDQVTFADGTSATRSTDGPGRVPVPDAGRPSPSSRSARAPGSR